MATVTRQPFAPLDGSRLGNLISLKNRQNVTFSPTGKRKVHCVDDDSENVDPLFFFAKRSKGTNGNAIGGLKGTFVKPTNFLLPTMKQTLSTPTHSLASANPAPRCVIQPKSPATKLNTSITKSSNLSAPAGRSPMRGKRSGILSSRRRTGGYNRIDPPVFKGLCNLYSLSSSSSAFASGSLDAALKATIPSYASKRILEDTIEDTSVNMTASWFFDVHEDTPEQQMTNMLQHGTCVLNISSDEETEQKAKRHDCEDKENVPPMDDVSQTSRRGRIVNDSEEQQAATPRQSTEPMVEGFAFASQPVEVDVDALMTKPEAASDVKSSKAAVLPPIEGTGESFELWESGSSKDDNEAPIPQSP